MTSKRSINVCIYVIRLLTTNVVFTVETLRFSYRLWTVHNILKLKITFEQYMSVCVKHRLIEMILEFC